MYVCAPPLVYEERRYYSLRGTQGTGELAADFFLGRAYASKTKRSPPLGRERGESISTETDGEVSCSSERCSERRVVVCERGESIFVRVKC